MDRRLLATSRLTMTMLPTEFGFKAANACDEHSIFAIGVARFTREAVRRQGKALAIRRGKDEAHLAQHEIVLSHAVARAEVALNAPGVIAHVD
ncbi:hypothetical protein D3C85_1431460 [compost metagenome]